jgi:hypothetical protein
VKQERRAGARRRFAAASIVVLTATACQGQERATPTPPPHGRFTSAEMDAIVLGPSDALAGTTYVGGASGLRDLESFARDDAELAHLRADRFQVGHVALFLPKGHANGAAPASLTNESVIVQGITGLFHDAVGAERARERYVGDLRSRQLFESRDVSSDGLGDRATGLLGTTPDGAEVLIYVWRIDNLLLAVSGVGPVARERVRALADLLDGRASSGLPG